jgi:acyl carrier protein
MDWSNAAAQMAHGNVPPLVRDLLQHQQSSREASKEWLEFVEKLRQSPPAERVDILVHHVQEEAARVLRLDPDAKLDPHVPLNELGFDSLMAVELANQLTSATGISLPVTLLFDYPTLHAMSGYIVRNVLELDTGDEPMADEEDSEVTPKASEITANMLESIGKLTDEEVAAQLLR